MEYLSTSITRNFSKRFTLHEISTKDKVMHKLWLTSVCKTNKNKLQMSRLLELRRCPRLNS